MAWGLVAIGLLLLIVLGYWQMIVAEGSYLGPRVVTFLYDLTAPAYERIKQFDPGYEQWFLGLPLGQALEKIPSPLVLDVGTGTGRLPRALLFQPAFRGQVVGIDLSRRMLAHAVQLAQPYRERLALIWQDAQDLPFEANSFDAVTCLEVLEFTPHPQAVLREMVRVLRPGGVLLVTNRVGKDAWVLPRRAFARPDFEALLRELDLENVRIQSWQADYDLVWGVKSGVPRGGGVRPLSQVLRCPACHHNPLPSDGTAFTCPRCALSYPVAPDGVIEIARPSHKSVLEQREQPTIPAEESRI